MLLTPPFGHTSRIALGPTVLGPYRFTEWGRMTRYPRNDWFKTAANSVSCYIRKAGSTLEPKSIETGWYSYTVEIQAEVNNW